MTECVVNSTTCGPPPTGRASNSTCPKRRRLSLPQNQKQSRLSRQEEINSTKSSKRMGTEKKSQMLGFPWVQPFLHWHPYLPSPPYSLHLTWSHRNLNWSKAAGDGLPFGFPPPLSSGPQTSRWRISYWGWVGVKGKVSQAQLTSPPWNYSFTQSHPSLSLCSLIPLPKGLPLSILSAETVSFFKAPPKAIISQSLP